MEKLSRVLLPLDDCQYPPGRSPEHLTERE
nr:MAG TPA: hypothetical protein [Caudoviricetes sp.]DAM70323.1 MAG TPA: hypothetical protein [Caudoviricetes sp.]